nr:hypothetical protein [Tanacetum cinerariifolium]
CFLFFCLAFGLAILRLYKLDKRDAEITDLKAKLEKAEREAAEVVELRRHVSELEAGIAAKSGEVAGLNGKNFELLGKETSVELDAHIPDVRRDIDNDLYPHMFIAIAERRWVLSHDVCRVVMKCAQFVECQSALGKVISLAINKGIQEGLEARIEHGK